MVFYYPPWTTALILWVCVQVFIHSQQSLPCFYGHYLTFDCADKASLVLVVNEWPNQKLITHNQLDWNWDEVPLYKTKLEVEEYENVSGCHFGFIHLKANQ